MFLLGLYVLREIDALEGAKTVKWTAEKISEAIKIIGPLNIMEIIAKNSHSCKVDSVIIEGRHDNIFWIPVWFLI
jgi:hypothetical protein